MKKLLLATVALLALSGGANAAFISYLGVDSNAPVARVFGATSFVDQYTFTLVEAQVLTIASVLNNFPGGVGGGRFITGFTGSVFFDGADMLPFTGDDVRVIGPSAATLGCGVGSTICQSLTGSAILSAGGCVRAL